LRPFFEINKNKENLMLKQKILDLELELHNFKNNKIDSKVESNQCDYHTNNMIDFVNKIMMKLKDDNENLIKENLELNKKIFDLNLNLTKLNSQYKMVVG
jgi:hypothetical protein